MGTRLALQVRCQPAAGNEINDLAAFGRPAARLGTDKSGGGIGGFATKPAGPDLAWNAVILPLRVETPMETVEAFLAHSIRLEEEAALRFGQLADAMASAGNREVGRLFRKLADYSRLHAGVARERSGFREIPALAEDEFHWPDIESPESAAIWAADPFIGREEALKVALDAERAGLAFYQGILDTTDDPEIRAFAREFVDEERQHVQELQRWLALHFAGEALPAQP